MKHLIARTFTSLMLAAVGLPMAAQAQSTQVIKASIPFEFNIGDKTFPAGDYTLAQPLQHVLALRDSRGQTVAQVVVGGVESLVPSAQTELKFAHSEDQNVLTEVWQKYGTSGLRVYPVENRTSLAKHSSEARAAAEGSRP